MPVTKITLSTAMRARDVSRPRAEQLADAAEREEALGRPAEQPSPGRGSRPQATHEPVPRETQRDQGPRDAAPRQQPQPKQQPGNAEAAPAPRRRRRRRG